MDMMFISPLKVQKLLEENGSSVQVVDSRSFIYFNRGHVLSAVNVYCTPLLKKRHPNCLPIEGIMSKDVKRCMSRPNIDTVIIYDEDSDQLNGTTVNSDLQLIVKTFSYYYGNKKIYILSGGFLRFKQECPRLCKLHPPSLGSLGHTLTLSTLSHPTQLSIKVSNQYHTRPDLFTERSVKRARFTTSPVELLPYLFLGDACHSSMKDQLINLGITAILNVSTSCANHFPQDFRYKIIPVEDTASADLHPWFKDAIQFIDDVRTEGGKVLVHCKGGISRSVTICLAYLMSTRCVRLEDAFDYIKSRRESISPNANFMMQLYDYEKTVISKQQLDVKATSCQLAPPRGQFTFNFNPTLTSSSDSNISLDIKDDNEASDTDIELSHVKTLRLLGKTCVPT